MIKHVKHVTCLYFVFIQRRLAGVSHANGCGVDNDIEGLFFKGGALEETRACRPRQFLRRAGAAIQSVNLRPALSQTVRRRPPRPARLSPDTLTFIQPDA